MDSTVIAAAIGVGGSVIVAVAGFWASVINTNKTTALAGHTVELTKQGQVTDRYSKAVEQLGSENLDVRLGAIYALESLARDWPEEYPTVMEVLAVFVREHSREKWPDPSGGGWRRSTRPDVQAALTVVGRRDAERDIRPIDLTGAKLTGADLTGANLTGADIPVANLAEAKLSGAKLTGAAFYGGDLTLANLSGANLAGANLNANLAEADLSGANLSGADLTNAELTGAIWSADTPVPEGWKLDTDSGRLVRAGIGSGPAEAN